MRKTIATLIAGLAAAGGALLWWRQQQPQSDSTREKSDHTTTVPATISRSAQPHMKARLRPSASVSLRDVPAPDSAEEGRTPYYFVPGEALVTLHSQEPLDAAFLEQVAERVGARYLPTGDRVVTYPDPEKDGWYTVARVKWEGASYEGTLERFVTLENQVNEGLAWEQAQVASWMPNWLGSLASAERLYTPGGPGSYPRPVPFRAGRLPLAETTFLGEWRQKMDRPITLAIVDAFPTAEQLEGRELPEALKPLAEKLRALPDNLSVDASRHYATFRTGEPFAMADHGLMSSWLAIEVIGEEAMKKVKVEPVRVATADGVCSVADAIAGLAPLVSRARDGELIVALLAFVIGMGDIIPPRIRPYEEHYEALRLVCLALSESGGTLVGASGNDATGLQHPPRTRRPASFRSVIEVTAGQLNQPGLALYANQAKALALFGGETNLAFETAENIPALIGPAIAPELRVSGKATAANEHGWVAWAGTSFAAAMAAGLAVLLRSREPGLKMWDVRTQLRTLATDSRHPGNVPFIDLVRASESD